MTYSEIVSSININLVKFKRGKNHNCFFIGITNNLDKKLYGSHKINRDTDWHIIYQADSLEIAEDVIYYFGILGMNSNHAESYSNNDKTFWVYCYEITMHSVE